MNVRTAGLSVLALAATSAGVSAQTADGRCFELRTYVAAPGKLDALQARFRDHTVALFKKHGMEVVGFWVPTDKEAGAGEKLIYLLAHKSRSAAEASWKAFRSDPVWVAARKASEEQAGGSLTTKVETVFLAPTDYSSMK
jgi:hypothetical protein